MNDLYEYLFKIILIGDWGVGKSNILLRITQDAFDAESRTTIGVEFSQKVMNINQQKIVVQIWDTAGQDRYKAITSAYYRSASAAILVYDISKRSSFENLQNWINEIRENTSESISIMLLGNKIDLESSRAITKIEGEEYARKNQFLFMEVSALSGENIIQAFNSVVLSVYKTTKGDAFDPRRPGSNLSFTSDEQSSKCYKLKKGLCC